MKERNRQFEINTKGFTLIELLAAIVLIAVIVLIIVPAITGVIENARKKTLETSAHGLVRIVDNEIGTVGIPNVGEERLYHFENDTWISDATFKFGGGKPDSMKIVVSSEGDVSVALFNNGFCAQKGFEEKEFIITKANDKTECITIEEMLAACPNILPSEIDDLISAGYIPITSADELNNVRLNVSNTFGSGTDYEGTYTGGLDKNYILLDNIDLISYLNWTPLGNSSVKFTGSLNGLNCTISNLTINNSTQVDVGLFGWAEKLSGTSTINNLKIENADVTSTYCDNQYGFGILAGTLGPNYIVDKVTVNGTMNSNCMATGGLVGWLLDSSVSNATANVSITSNDDKVGGLIGGTDSQTEVTNSSTEGIITAVGKVGGLIGYNYGLVVESFSTAEVNGSAEVGGLIGESLVGSAIFDSYATGIVTGTGNYTAGLIGQGNFELTNSHFLGAVNGTSYVGGLVGNHWGGFMTNSYNEGTVTGIGYLGGIAGASGVNITDSHSIANVTGTSARVGGLTGNMYGGTVLRSYATGNIIGSNETAGLTGVAFNGFITDSYATGDVDGYEMVGGLVGRSDDSVITTSYAAGNVTGHEVVGGLIGLSYYSQINNSYISGTSASGNNRIGGYIGWTRFSTATGATAGTVSSVGIDYGNVTYRSEDSTINGVYYNGISVDY